MTSLRRLTRPGLLALAVLVSVVDPASAQITAPRDSLEVARLLARDIIGQSTRFQYRRGIIMDPRSSGWDALVAGALQFEGPGMLQPWGETDQMRLPWVRVTGDSSSSQITVSWTRCDVANRRQFGDLFRYSPVRRPAGWTLGPPRHTAVLDGICGP